MIDVKQAINIAKSFAGDVLNSSDLLLEEVVSEDDAFEITLSFPKRIGAPINPLSVASQLRLRYGDEREFKVFRVMKSDGSVARMTIRQIA